MPGITITDGFRIPRSIPITCPFTFSSPPVDCHLANVDAVGVRAEGREKDATVRGSCID